MELKKVRSPRELRDHPAAPGRHSLAVGEWGASHFYWVLEADERVGLLELHHPAGERVARLVRVALDGEAGERVEQVALFELVAERARRLGARVLLADTRLDTAELEQRGWRVLSETWRVARPLT
jgi:hypothetical protein